MGHTLEELRSMGTAKDAFDKVMEYPISHIGSCFGLMKLDGRCVEVKEWPNDEATQEIKDA